MQVYNKIEIYFLFLFASYGLKLPVDSAVSKLLKNMSKYSHFLYLSVWLQSEMAVTPEETSGRKSYC